MLQDRSKYPRIPVSRLSKMMTLSLNKAFQAKGFSITNEQEIILRTLRMNVFKGIEPEELEQFSRTAEKYMKNIDELLGTREGASADG